MKQTSQPTTGASQAGEEHSDLQWMLAAFWKFFSSMKTAIYLLLMLAVVSVIGTLVKGEGNKPVDFFATPWYGFLLALVGINLLICSLNRFGIAWKQTFHPRVAFTPESLGKNPGAESMVGRKPLHEAGESVIAALRAGGYRVAREGDDRSISLYAVKGRFRVWGSYLTHLSILVIFIGAVAGNQLGISDGYLKVVEGKSKDFFFRGNSERRQSLGFGIKLNELGIGYDAGHHPTSYESKIDILQGDTPIAQKVISVNHPLAYRGVSLYQTNFGLVGFLITIKAPGGKKVPVPYNLRTVDSAETKSYHLTDNPVQIADFQPQRVALSVKAFEPDFVNGRDMGFLPVNPAVELDVSDRYPVRTPEDDWKSLGWLTVGKPADYHGFTITLERVVRFSELSVTSNPGLPAVYCGFALLLLGILISFYLPFRTIRVALSARAEGVKMVALLPRLIESSVDASEMARLRQAIECTASRQGDGKVI